jgi:hypothetical protein
MCRSSSTRNSSPWAALMRPCSCGRVMMSSSMTKLVSRMSGGLAWICFRRSSDSPPVYRAKVTGGLPPGRPLMRNLSSRRIWLFASVHGVDDDGADPARTVLEHPVDDRDEVREALAGASSPCQKVADTGTGTPDGIILVLMELHGLAEVGGCLVTLEDLAAGWVQDLLVDELVDYPHRSVTTD